MSGVLPKVVGAAVVVAILLIVILLSISLKKLDSQEVGLEYDTVQRKLAETPSFEGLHAGPPGFRYIIFPNVFLTLDFSDIQCLNIDGVEIRLSIGYQYRIRPNDLHKIAKQFRTHDDFKRILTTIGESAIHEACSKFNTSQFQAERGAFQEDVRSRLVSKYDPISTDVTDLQVNDILRPQEYETAVKQKETAREDIEVAENERPQKLTEAQTKVLEAETEAQVTLDKAYSDAKIISARAAAEAEAILHQYNEEAVAYKKLKTDLLLDNAGFLSYMGIRTIEDAKLPINVNVKAPAKTSWINTP